MRITFLVTFLLCGQMVFSQQQHHPFPQHAIYSSDVIVPDHVSQKILDDSTTSFYDQWKVRYVKKSDCSDALYIWAEGSAKECVSEGQGYGMMIVAYMAGHDALAQQTFDGLFHYYKMHPSKRNALLMSWAQTKDCSKMEASSATDGDIDIAYSLLLADAQWTSNGNINYLQEAKAMINAIMQQEINTQNWNVMPSNSIEYDSQDYFDMRSSDFIPSAFKAFYAVTKDEDWNKVIEKNYALFQELQKKYSIEAGLIPDFIQHINKIAVPAKRFYLESKYDGLYNYNACRVPWRIGTNYIVDGDAHAKAFVTPINKWIRETSSNDPDNISAGYTLSGEDLPTRNFEALSFISSFSVSAMVDKSNQQWLNKLWDYIINFKLTSFDYYDNSIKMLNLILLSHNYWTP